MPKKYSDSSNYFLIKNATKFLEYIKIDNYTIKLKKDKQLLFKFIYS